METDILITGNDVKAIMTSNYIEPDSIEGYIQAGKGIVKTSQCYQALLAHYALKVCQIKHGGYSKGIYTVKNYADDIGMHYKTLQNWTLIYRRVVAHLDIKPEKMTQKDWHVATKVAYLQENENRANNIVEGTPRKRNEYKPSKIERTSEQIKRSFEANFVQTFENEISNWNNSILQMKRKLLVRDLRIANKLVLIEFMQHLDEMSDHVNDFLTDSLKGKH